MPENDWIVVDYNTGREYSQPSSEKQAKKIRRVMEREKPYGNYRIVNRTTREMKPKWKKGKLKMVV